MKGIASIHWKVFSTSEDDIRTCGDNASTARGNCGVIPPVQWRLASTLWGITWVLWRLLSTVEIKI